jgi:hypothetical protein
MRSSQKCKFYKPRSKKGEARTSVKDDAERAERESECEQQKKKNEVCGSLMKKLTLVAPSANQKVLTSIVERLLWPLFLKAEISIKCLADATSLCKGIADLLIIGNFATIEYFLRIQDGDRPRCAAQVVCESGSTYIGDFMPQEVLYGILKVGYSRACFLGFIHSSISPSLCYILQRIDPDSKIRPDQCAIWMDANLSTMLSTDDGVASTAELEKIGFSTLSARYEMVVEELISRKQLKPDAMVVLMGADPITVGEGIAAAAAKSTGPLADLEVYQMDHLYWVQKWAKHKRFDPLTLGKMQRFDRGESASCLLCLLNEFMCVLCSSMRSIHSYVPEVRTFRCDRTHRHLVHRRPQSLAC